MFICACIYLHVHLYTCTYIYIYTHRVYLTHKWGWFYMTNFYCTKSFWGFALFPSLVSLPSHVYVIHLLCSTEFCHSLEAFVHFLEAFILASWQYPSMLMEYSSSIFFKHFTLCQNAILDSFDQIGFHLKKPVVKTDKVDTFLNTSNSLQSS